MGKMLEHTRLAMANAKGIPRGNVTHAKPRTRLNQSPWLENAVTTLPSRQIKSLEIGRFAIQVDPKRWLILRMYYYAKSAKGRGFGARDANSVSCGYWLTRPEYRKIMQFARSSTTEEMLSMLAKYETFAALSGGKIVYNVEEASGPLSVFVHPSIDSPRFNCAQVLLLLSSFRISSATEQEMRLSHDLEGTSPPANHPASESFVARIIHLEEGTEIVLNEAVSEHQSSNTSAYADECHLNSHIEPLHSSLISLWHADSSHILDSSSGHLSVHTNTHFDPFNHLDSTRTHHEASSRYPHYSRHHHAQKGHGHHHRCTNSHTGHGDYAHASNHSDHTEYKESEFHFSMHGNNEQADGWWMYRITPKHGNTGSVHHGSSFSGHGTASIPMGIEYRLGSETIIRKIVSSASYPAE